MALIDASFSGFLRAILIGYAAYSAYAIRLMAVHEYGRIIHEFDPWFNFRATQYLAENGWKKFSTWFDYMSWYPLGRPVGSTIYPGMQITAVTLWKVINVFRPFSLNDTCVFFPAWFGAAATVLTAMLTYECSGSTWAGVVAALIMAVIPAHTMRSIAGGYDNESLAVTAMILTFYSWARSNRNEKSWPLGAVAGLCYVYMVAAWGGYTFVLNMVGLHAAALVALNHYTDALRKAYSLFWIVGTLGAIQFPVVGLQPIKSAEQIGPMFVFFGLNIIGYGEMLVKKQKLQGDRKKAWQLRIRVYTGAATIACAICAALAPTGWFGPLSVRVRGLFIKHTQTGNPLVDSVAEHQPGTADAYERYLHQSMFMTAPIGFLFAVAHFFAHVNPQSLFLPLYACVAYYFANRMVRLIIFLGPIAASLCGIAVGYALDDLHKICKKYAVRYLEGQSVLFHVDEDEKKAKGEANNKANGPPAKLSNTKMKKKYSNGNMASSSSSAKNKESFANDPRGAFSKVYHSNVSVLFRLVIICLGLANFATMWPAFMQYSHDMAEGMSMPSVMFKGQLRDGRVILVRDYMDAYEWVRDNTPEDARIMAWWDYGYQITGIANRTSIADGNTWNHEHIANLARTLTAPEDEAYDVIRHLADYVLVWTGGGSDDMAKSPHLFRIGASIGQKGGTVDMMDIHRKFGVDRQGRPTPMMANSLLYKLVSFEGGVSEDHFEEVFTTKFRKVRVYKVVDVDIESRNWLADPNNRVCDPPGSWQCPGRYPPALKKYPKLIKPAYPAEREKMAAENAKKRKASGKSEL
jgi:dolichyl-diphosphooligosaccharide--protein glycosyltransferase